MCYPRACSIAVWISLANRSQMTPRCVYIFLDQNTERVILLNLPSWFTNNMLFGL